MTVNVLPFRPFISGSLGLSAVDRVWLDTINTFSRGNGSIDDSQKKLRFHIDILNSLTLHNIIQASDKIHICMLPLLGMVLIHDTFKPYTALHLDHDSESFVNPLRSMCACFSMTNEWAGHSPKTAGFAVMYSQITVCCHTVRGLGGSVAKSSALSPPEPQSGSVLKP